MEQTTERLLSPCSIKEQIILDETMKEAKKRYNTYLNLKENLEDIGIDASGITSTSEVGRCWEWHDFPSKIWVGGFLFKQNKYGELRVLQKQDVYFQRPYSFYEATGFDCGNTHFTDENYKIVKGVSDLKGCPTRDKCLDFRNNPECQLGCKTKKKKDKPWYKFW